MNNHYTLYKPYYCYAFINFLSRKSGNTMCVIIVRWSIMNVKEKRVCSCESNCSQLQEVVANIVDLEKQYLIVSK